MAVSEKKRIVDIEVYSDLLGCGFLVAIDAREIDGVGSHYIFVDKEKRRIEELMLGGDVVDVWRLRLGNVRIKKGSDLSAGEVTKLLKDFVKDNGLVVEREGVIKSRLIQVYKKRFDVVEVKYDFNDLRKVVYGVVKRGSGWVIEKRNGVGERGLLDRVFVNGKDGFVYRNRVKVGEIEDIYKSK